MSRRTKVIQYSLKDRGRTYTGQSRDNVDVPTLIAHINSPKVQEMVKTNSLVGYYGHQIRQRFGMNPPETAFVDGRQIRLEPAFKTIKLSADPATGMVEHQQEFFENDAGEYTLRQYKGKVGGFSSAVSYRNVGAKLQPTAFNGFDFVFQPNYAGNTGNGMFDSFLVPESMGVDNEIPCFDSILDQDLSPQLLIAQQAIEGQIIQIYDNIQMALYSSRQQEMALDRVAELELENQRLAQRMKARKARQEQREIELLDSALCPTQSMLDALQDAETFLNAGTGPVPEENEKPEPQSKKSGLPGIRSGFFGWRG